MVRWGRFGWGIRHLVSTSANKSKRPTVAVPQRFIGFGNKANEEDMKVKLKIKAWAEAPSLFRHGLTQSGKSCGTRIDGWDVDSLSDL